MKETNENHITLKIFGNKLDSEEITKTLNLTPSKVQKEGQTDDFNRTVKENLWEFRLTHHSNEWIGKMVTHFISEYIKPRKVDLLQIAKSSKIELSIIQYFYEGSNPGYHFDSHDLKLLGDIGIELDIDIYCLEEN